MHERTLPGDVVVMPGTDVAGLWDRYEIFEALHHGMRICNPMSGDDLDAVLDALAPRHEETMLDIACGHGELLIRAAERARISGRGVDQSPWVLARASAEAHRRQVGGALAWWLGDAHELPGDERFNIVTCLGASWIWHGFEGTVRAMMQRCTAGARIAIGDLRLRAGRDPGEVTETYGRVLTLEEQEAFLGELGVELLATIDASDAGWDGYQDRILSSVTSWAAEHPGETAEQYRREEQEWRESHRRDRALLDWTIWIGRVK